jgi:hypothetical protein
MKLDKLEKVIEGAGEVKDYTFKQIKETELGYIYEVHTDGKLRHYEVFRKRLSEKCIDFDKKIYDDNHLVESYPKSRVFGITAFTIPRDNYERAEEILNNFAIKNVNVNLKDTTLTSEEIKVIINSMDVNDKANKYVHLSNDTLKITGNPGNHGEEYDKLNKWMNEHRWTVVE